MAKDISPPFLLTTHTQTLLPISEDKMCKPASMFKNHLLHVIGGEGDFNDALQLLADIEEDSEAHQAQEKSKTEELTAKLSKLSVRNVDKRIERRDDKIAESQGHIKEMEDDKKVQDKRIHKLEYQLHTAHASVHCLHQRLSRSNKKVEATSLENTDVNSQLCEMETEFSTKIAKLQEKVEVLITEVELARHERDILSKCLDDIQVGTIRTKEGRKFTDSVRQCCIELLSMNVATNQVEPVIRSVLQNIATIEVSALPKASSLSGILAEMKCLAYQQISDELDHQENITLHSDGTSKFGEHYGSINYQQKRVCIPLACVKC